MARRVALLTRHIGPSKYGYVYDSGTTRCASGALWRATPRYDWDAEKFVPPMWYEMARISVNIFAPPVVPSDTLESYKHFYSVSCVLQVL